MLVQYFNSFIILLLLTTTALSDSHPRNLHGIEAIAANVQRTKDCPAGSELLGKQCVATQFLEPNLICPPGTTSLNGECVTFARASRVCSKGLTAAGDRCSSTQVVPASLVCDQGDLVTDQCRITTEVPPICPAGLQLQNGQCVRYTPQQKVCASGYQLQGKDCVRTTNFPAAPVCPSDFSLIGVDQCTKSVPVPPRCNSGFSLIGHECVKQVSQVPAPCPHGFTPSTRGCQRRQESPVRPVCPPEFILDSQHQCVQEIPVSPTCPSGTSRAATGQCERPVAKLPVCDSGEELVGGRCKRSSLFASELECQHGYALIHNKCKRVHAEEPVLRCSSGILKGDQCIHQSTTTPLLQCPAGYQLVKGPKCTRDVTYDCSKSVVKTECEMPSFVAELASHRHLHADYKFKEVPPVEFKGASKSVPAQVAESKSPKCSSVKQLVPQTCTKTEAAPIQYVCVDGSAPQGKSCNVVSTSPAEAYCKAGQLDNATGQCITIDIKPSTKVCRTGNLQADGNCLQVDEKPATLICPEGSQLNQGKDGRCVIVQAEVVHPNRVVRRSPQEVCDVGVKQGKVCVEVEEMPRGQICPSGSEDRSGRCVVTSPVISPEPTVVTRRAQYVCQDGSAASGKSCFSRESIPAEYVCRDGGNKEGSRCVHTAELVYPPARITHSAPRPVCPHGYQQQGRQCSLTTSEPADLQCPSGFTRSTQGAQECIRTHERVPVCPAGTQQGAKGCVKKTYTPPRVTEIKVCTKGQPGC